MNDGELQTARLYAWIANDPDGVEGIITIPTGDGLLPLVVSDRKTADSVKEFARLAARARRTKARLVVFERGEVLDAT